MFTGIVSAVGTVEGLSRGEGVVSVAIGAPDIAAGLDVGGSVSVNGVCLTATSATESQFTVDIVSETLDRSTLGGLSNGDRVNLERPVPVSGRLDGHIVQGHVDGVGKVLRSAADGDEGLLEIELPQHLARYVVEKGSIAVHGVSLTIATVAGPVVSIALVPHTLSQTVLGDLSGGDEVNIEVDVLAKYVERLLEVRQ